ncbi:hypothetical protein FHG87_012622 [Trinorchestia longiramus]|nr:hypothetical protein FHG87_012622 [Trinorchestia longiramus]
MKIQLVIMLLLVAVVTLSSAAPQLITTPRKFPGERRLGATNYSFHSFGKKGYSGRRKNNRSNRNSIRRGVNRRSG